MTANITFGTDGWRDVIADGFTFANLRTVAQAIADYVKSQGLEGASAAPVLMVGHDTRFLAREFAEEAASVLAAAGLGVLLATDFVPTPAVSFTTRHRGLAGAVMVTASHNPPVYSGLKFKAAYGGSATGEIMRQIAERWRQNREAGREPQTMPLAEAVATGQVTIFDPAPDYLSHLKSLLELRHFRAVKLKVAVDPMFGAGQGYLAGMLRELGCQVEEIHGTVDPNFGGLNPEPIEPNLGELRRAVVEGGFDLGLALDGDADRVGAIDAKGNFVNSHQIFALLLRHLVEERKLTGRVIKTVSTTRMIDRLARRYELELIETPIGFKYICDHMLDGGALIGGEESGGITVTGHVPERDGILCGLLLAEIVLATGKPLAALTEALMELVGPCYYDRVDREIIPDGREALLSRLRDYEPAEINGKQVVSINRVDGFKFIMADESWLIIRPSGTEPVVRIYAEAPSRAEVSALLAAGEKLLVPDSFSGKD